MTFHEYALAHADELTRLTCDMTLIPAPSGHERERAEFCAEWLKNAGAEGVEIDESLNVVWRALPGKSGKWIIFSAHTDTVFDLDVPLEIKEEDGKLYCPGIGDDTANLAVLMLGMRYLIENPPKDNEYGVLFLATASEEVGSVGMYNYLTKHGTDDIHFCYSFDASSSRIYTGTVNYYNHLVTVHGPGGHALGAFGTPSAIEELSRIILDASAACREYIASNKLKRTTINVGMISGGNRHNIIATEASALIELRSDKYERYEVLASCLRKSIAKYSTDQITVENKIVSDTAHWNTVPDEVMQRIGEEHREIMRSVGIEPRFSSACTDCRYPMSKGIPSLDLGLCKTSYPHSLGELLYPESLPAGLETLLLIFEKYL
jgi:acetylornithine deacetylase/succinyl-diaminopimelate desuccinylase-like protein